MLTTIRCLLFPPYFTHPIIIDREILCKSISHLDHLLPSPLLGQRTSNFAKFMSLPCRPEAAEENDHRKMGKSKNKVMLVATCKF